MLKTDVVDMRGYPLLRCLFWDFKDETDKIPVRDAFRIFARRIGEYVDPERMNAEERELVECLQDLFEDDLPEVFYER